MAPGSGSINNKGGVNETPPLAHQRAFLHVGINLTFLVGREIALKRAVRMRGGVRERLRVRLRLRRRLRARERVRERSEGGFAGELGLG